MLTDLAHALRSLSRTPASAGAAVLTIALVLGAGVSLVTLVEEVLWTPLPFPDAQSLVHVGETPLSDPQGAMRPVTRSTFEAWSKASEGVLSALEAYDATNVTLSGDGHADRVGANRVSPTFFTTLGVRPSLGRVPSTNDAGKVVVISSQLWRARFGGDPDVLGRTLTVAAEPHVIIGVLPDEFRFAVSNGDLWMPLSTPTSVEGENARLLRVVGRLAPGATTAAAAAALDRVSVDSVPSSRAVVRPLRDVVVGNAAGTLWLLAAAAAFALVMAAANLAGLLLMRWADREREIAIRAALGASRWVPVRSIVAESHLIVAAGAAGGLMLAMWLSPLVQRIAADQINTALLTSRTVGVKTMWLLAAGALFAAWASAAQPIMRALRSARILDSAQRGSTPRLRGFAGRGLIVGQLTISFVLLAALVGVGQSLRGMLSTDAGFSAERVLTMRVAVPAAVYPDNDRVAMFYSTLQLRLREALGPTVAIIDELPLTHDRGRADVAAAAGREPVDTVIRTAGPDYFDVMSIPLIFGRSFDAGDHAGAPARVVLGAALARRLFPDRDPVGQRIWFPNTRTSAEVVGVVGNVKLASLDESDIPLLYVSALQQPSRGVHLVIRSALPDASVLAEVRRIVASVDPDVPVYAPLSLQEVVRTSRGLPTRRVLIAAFSAFTTLALAVMSIGLFGLLSHHVARRRREIAIRMTLGASPQRLRTNIVAQTSALALGGIVGGALLSVPATAALRGLVGDPGPFELTPYIAAGVVSLSVALIAGFGPAQRAARTNPVVMLRAE